MAIPDQQQLQQLKTRLQDRRRQLIQDMLQQLRESGDKNFEAVAGEVHDAGDESVASMLGSISAMAAEQGTRELAEVEAALKRMEKGEYGKCIDCGEPVGIERLQASPSASRCIGCQQQLEGPAGGRDQTPTL